MRSDVEVMIVYSVEVGSIYCVLVFVLGLVRQQEEDFVDHVLEEPAVFLGCDEVRIQPWEDTHVFLGLVLNVDVFLGGRRAFFWVEEGKHLGIHCLYTSLGVQVVLDVLEPFEGFSEAELFSRDYASIFSEDHQKGHIVNDVLAFLSL